MRRQRSVVLRFCAYELEELDQLIQSNWGPMPRGSVINEALGYFLHSPSSKDLEMCRKRKVNILIDRDKLRKLNEYAQSHRVNRADLIRFAIHKFIPMFAKGEIVESF